MVRYGYSIANDTANGAVNTTQLLETIRATATITISVFAISTNGDDLDIDFNAALSIAEEAILDGLVAVHTGTASVNSPLEVNIVENQTSPKKDADANLKVTVQPRIGTGCTIITHNFGDPCTWYQKSIEVINEVATVKTPSVYTVYSLAHTNIIDIEHGRLTFDNRVDQKYCIRVKVNDVIQTTGFTFNYESGEITFNSALTANDVVKISYYYSTTNEFTISPDAGKKLKIENVELQFSIDLDMQNKTHCYFEERGYNPNNLPNKMTYKTAIYKNIINFIDESNNKLFNTIQPRDNMTVAMDIFVWQYPVSRVMKSSQGAEVLIYMKDVATGSKSLVIKNKDGNNLERAVATFYCASEIDE